MPFKGVYGDQNVEVLRHGWLDVIECGDGAGNGVVSNHARFRKAYDDRDLRFSESSKLAGVASGKSHTFLSSLQRLTTRSAT